MAREWLDDRYRIDIGRADGGRSFVRVIELSTGNSRTQVGFNGEPAAAIARRLATEIEDEANANRSAES